MEYYVHAVARTHSFYDDIVVKLPIVIVGDKVRLARRSYGSFENGLILSAYPGSR